jgi:hypothetical protein
MQPNNCDVTAGGNWSQLCAYPLAANADSDDLYLPSELEVAVAMTKTFPCTAAPF